MDILLAVFILTLFIDFLLAASEIALATFGENRIEELEESDNKLIPYFEELNANQEEVYSSTHLAITFLNILLSITGYFLLSNLLLPFDNNLFPENEILAITITVILCTIIITVIILMFVFLIPKAIAYRYSDFIGKKSIKTILLLSSVLKYVAGSITFLSNIFLLPVKEKINFSQERPSEDEILDIISDGVKSGTINESDREIIENIFEFNDLRANEVMVPRTEMIAINLEEDDEKNIDNIIKSNHTLVPVYEKSMDNLLGVLHTKDVMKSLIENKKVSLRSLIRPVYFVPEAKLISEILKEMQKQGERLAIVTDEYGGTEGVITMEDILEEIIGEIKDNTQSEIQNYNKLPDGKFYVLGLMNIDEFNETFNIKLEESDEYNTVAGFIAYKTGQILNSGDKFEYENLVFELIKKIRQKMVQFKVFDKYGRFDIAKND